MAIDKYTVEIVDSDGNMSKLVLPGFALDSTQERLIKSVQSLGKMNPKQAAAYEKLLAATNDVAKSGNKSTEKQTEEFEKVLKVTSEKQVNALKSFRENFADRVGRDMRNTFVAGGNILTAAIKTATVGLAAGAGLLYKTFMDTSDAFRSLAQSGLGGAGVSGREAQDAVSNLVQLGMSANEAASILTGFSRASAILGKANFSKFVSGISGASSFAADLGLSLKDAAEFAAEEIELRQSAMSSKLLLDHFERTSVKESIKLTQSMSTVFGRSMKDIQSSRTNFMQDNAQLATLMLRLPADLQQQVSRELSNALTIAGGLGGDIENVMKIFLNSAASAVPIADATVQQIAGLGPAGTVFIDQITQLSSELNSGSINAKQSMLRLVDTLAASGENNAELLSILEQSGDPVAGMIARAARDAKLGGEQLRKAILGILPAMDPMIASGARLENTINQLQGSFKLFGLQVLGGLAEPLDSFMKAFTDTGLTEEQQTAIDNNIKSWEKNNRIQNNWSEERLKQYEEERETFINSQYAQRNGITVMAALQKALNDVGRTVMKVFFNDVNPTAENFGKTLRERLIPWIEKTAEQFKKYLEDLKGDSIGDKLGTMLKDAFTNIVIPALITALKEGFKALFSHPEVILGLVFALSGLSLAKTLLTTATKAAGTWIATKLGLAAATTAATATTAAGATGLTALAARGTTGLAQTGTALKSLVPGSSASLATRAAGLSVVGSGLMVGKDAFDIGASLYKGESVKGEDVGGVIGGIIGGAIGVFGGPVGIAIGASLGNMAGNWIGSFFDDDEAEAAGAEVAQQTKEELLQQQGLFAMALDPEHIKAVSAALMVLDNVSLTNISNGLTEFNPAMERLFNNIQNVRIQLLDIVSNRLQRLVNIITGLNDQGDRLPATSDYMSNLGDKITNLSIDTIVTLANAFTALTRALRGFGDLTTSNRFDRMWDNFMGKEDTTESVIKVLNNFAEKVDSEKLLQAAQATQAFNSAMAGLYGQPEIQRTDIVRDTATPATTTTTGQQTVMHSPQETIFERIESQMILMRNDTKRMEEHLTAIKTNTRD